jgi:hypothetical protein
MSSVQSVNTVSNVDEKTQRFVPNPESSDGISALSGTTI